MLEPRGDEILNATVGKGKFTRVEIFVFPLSDFYAYQELHVNCNIVFSLQLKLKIKRAMNRINYWTREKPQVTLKESNTTTKIYYDMILEQLSIRFDSYGQDDSRGA